MTNVIALYTGGSIEHSDLFGTVTAGYYSDYSGMSEDCTLVESIIDTIENMSDTVQDTYRGDMITDVKN